MHNKNTHKPLNLPKDQNPKGYTQNCIGTQIKKARIYRGYKTQGDACTAVKTSRQVWSLWERGKRIPSVESLILLSCFFQLDLPYFCLPAAEPSLYNLRVHKKK